MLANHIVWKNSCVGVVWKKTEHQRREENRTMPWCAGSHVNTEWLNSPAFGVFSITFGVVSTLVWLTKLVLLMKNISPNPFHLSHIITLNLLLGSNSFISFGVVHLLKESSADTTCNALLALSFFLTVLVLMAQLIYSGWFFLWTLSLVINVTPYRKRCLMRLHFGFSVLFLVAELTGLAIYTSHAFQAEHQTDAEARHRSEDLMMTIVLANYFFLCYSGVLFTFCFTLLWRKFWKYPPAIIREARFVWASHLTLLIFLCTTVIVLPISAGLVMADPDYDQTQTVVCTVISVVVIFTYAALLQLSIFITISTKPPQDESASVESPSIEFRHPNDETPLVVTSPHSTSLTLSYSRSFLVTDADLW